MPITVELPDGGFAFIQEASNFDKQWGGIKFALDEGSCKALHFQDPQGFSVPSSISMPWRVILVADNLNALLHNDIVTSLAPEPDKTILPDGSRSSWIKPGRSTWTWWVLCLAGSPFSIEILHNDDRVINEVRDRQNNGKNEI